MIIFGHRKEDWTPAPGLLHTGAGSAGETTNNRVRQAVFPADAGIQKVLTYECEDWTPAYAGETAKDKANI